MGRRRALLEGAYWILKRAGLLRLRNCWKDEAAIIMFHRVNDYDGSPLTAHTSVFDEMMRVLKEEYDVVPLGDLVRQMMVGDRLWGKAAVTFDDGYGDNLSCAAPILKKYGIPATFFVTSGFINTKKVFPWDVDNPVENPIMTWDDVRQLDRMGFEIGAHSMTHADLGRLSLEEARTEIRMAKQQIEAELGKEISAFAFPYGGRSNCKPEVSAVVKEEGFSYCCLGYGGKVCKYSDAFRLHRTYTYPTVLELAMDLDGFVGYFDGDTRILGFRASQFLKMVRQPWA